MDNLLALDIETGGIGEDKSLLTAFFAILNDKLEITSELDLKIKPDNGIYQVTAEALNINKINLVEHDKGAISYREAGTALYKFLEKASAPFPMEPGGFKVCIPPKFIPFGHGVAFDCKFLQNTIISSGSWEKFVSYRHLCTSSIARFLILQGKIPPISGSLESLVGHFKIEKQGSLHEAKTDVLASIELFKKLLAI